MSNKILINEYIIIYNIYYEHMLILFLMIETCNSNNLKTTILEKNFSSLNMHISHLRVL